MVSCQCRLEKARRRHAENGLCANVARALFSHGQPPLRCSRALVWHRFSIQLAYMLSSSSSWKRCGRVSPGPFPLQRRLSLSLINPLRRTPPHVPSE